MPLSCAALPGVSDLELVHYQPLQWARARGQGYFIDNRLLAAQGHLQAGDFRLVQSDGKRQGNALG